MGSRRARFTRSGRRRSHLTRSSAAVLTVLLLLGISDLRAQRREVVGYYPAWQYVARETLVTPLRLPYDRLTIINYAFFLPEPDGRLVGRNPEVDDLILLGTPDPATGVVRAETGLCSIAHDRGVKLLLSLGGWDASGNFPAIAASQDRRRTFARSCADAIRRYGFDGIDIDWEYPGYEPHNGTPADGANYLLMLREVRDTLDALGRASGRRPLLTIAVPAHPSQARGFDVSTAEEVLDFINIMTYDFHGAWDPVSDHNAPLFASGTGDPAQCVDASFRLYRDTYGFPAARINIGAAFYGRTYRNCTDIRMPHGGADTVNFPPEGTPHYHAITAVAGRCSRRWDDQAGVPYLVCDAWNSVVSYDDEESTALKAQYVVDNGIRGIIIWELTGDFFPDGSTPLLDTIHKVFTAAPRTK